MRLCAKNDKALFARLLIMQEADAVYNGNFFMLRYMEATDVGNLALQNAQKKPDITAYLCFKAGGKPAGLAGCTQRGSSVRAPN